MLFRRLITLYFLLVLCEQCYGQEADSYRKYSDYIPVKAVKAGIVKGSNSKILVAFFSRSGNTHVNADAVSSASLKINEDGTTTGNAEQIAEWVAQETGGDLFLIQTEYTYPVSYSQTVNVGEGQDIDGYYPVLVSHVENINQYDTIFLVYPIWHYTLPVPVCSFLNEYDFSSKKIYVFTTHAGSYFADSIQRIQEAAPNATVIKGIAINMLEMTGAKDRVIDFIKTCSN